MPRTVPGMCSVLRASELIIITAWSLYKNWMDRWKNEWCFLVKAFSVLLGLLSKKLNPTGSHSFTPNGHQWQDIRHSKKRGTPHRDMPEINLLYFSVSHEPALHVPGLIPRHSQRIAQVVSFSGPKKYRAQRSQETVKILYQNHNNHIPYFTCFMLNKHPNQLCNVIHYRRVLGRC